MIPTTGHHMQQGSRYLNCPLRQDLYVLLSHVLLQPPSGDLMRQLADLSWDSEMSPALSTALETLRTASRDFPHGMAEQEFEDLFIGMGRGEIIPYASWYAEKLLMGAPLVRLRDDLAQMQISRKSKVSEPEDHAAALCETMALMIRSPRIPAAQQTTFFFKHIYPWMIQFFQDLQQAPSARFYRIVGCLGEHFLRAEKQHLQPN